MAITGSSAPGDEFGVSERACCTWAWAPATVGADRVLSNNWRWLAVAALLNCASLACCCAAAFVIACRMPAVNPPGFRPIRLLDCAAVMSACSSEASSFMAETRPATRTPPLSAGSLLPAATWSSRASRVLILWA